MFLWVGGASIFLAIFLKWWVVPVVMLLWIVGSLWQPGDLQVRIQQPYLTLTQGRLTKQLPLEDIVSAQFVRTAGSASGGEGIVESYGELRIVTTTSEFAAKGLIFVDQGPDASLGVFARTGTKPGMLAYHWIECAILSAAANALDGAKVGSQADVPEEMRTLDPRKRDPEA